MRPSTVASGHIHHHHHHPPCLPAAPAVGVCFLSCCHAVTSSSHHSPCQTGWRSLRGLLDKPCAWTRLSKSAVATSRAMQQLCFHSSVCVHCREDSVRHMCLGFTLSLITSRSAQRYGEMCVCVLTCSTRISILTE